MTAGETAQGVLASSAGGTPKRGYWCGTCEDWGTIVVIQDVGDGVRLERERPCPDHTPPPQIPACSRCKGTGIVVVNIPIAGAVLSDPRPCPDCATTGTPS